MSHRALVRFINNLEEARRKYQKQSHLEISIEEDIMKIYKVLKTVLKRFPMSSRSLSARESTTRGGATGSTN